MIKPNDHAGVATIAGGREESFAFTDRIDRMLLSWAVAGVLSKDCNVLSAPLPFILVYQCIVKFEIGYSCNLHNLIRIVFLLHNRDSLTVFAITGCLNSDRIQSAALIKERITDRYAPEQQETKEYDG